MKNVLLASRYAKALYNLAREAGEQDVVFEQMRVVQDAFALDPEIQGFVESPVVRPSEKEKALKGVVEKISLSATLKHFLLVLAKKNRLGIFGDIVTAYQTFADEAHGVTRGVVRSAAVLDPEARRQIEELVSRATKKQVILNYKEDPTLLGGLVAEVGSFTFDDSLKSHLIRINEQLNRSAH
ncbi:MAG: ATP synthase F1 subunit delta [Bdellovibrionales bacterium]